MLLEMPDRSHGYDQLAKRFLELRAQGRIGESTVQAWAGTLAPESCVLDLGCGAGIPVSAVLLAHGFRVSAIDASPRMVAAYHAQFPVATVRCEAVEESQFFAQTFDAIVAVGLMFLLAPAAQTALIPRVARALRSRGQFMFTAPEAAVTWADAVTGAPSVSLGAARYRGTPHGGGMHTARRVGG